MPPSKKHKSKDPKSIFFRDGSCRYLRRLTVLSLMSSAVVLNRMLDWIKAKPWAIYQTMSTRCNIQLYAGCFNEETAVFWTRKTPSVKHNIVEEFEEACNSGVISVPFHLNRHGLDVSFSNTQAGGKGGSLVVPVEKKSSCSSRKLI